MPASFLVDGSTVCGDSAENKVDLVVIKFSDDRQLTYFGEEANKFMLHYVNGTMTRDITGIPMPKSVEWNEVKRLQ